MVDLVEIARGLVLFELLIATVVSLPSINVEERLREAEEDENCDRYLKAIITLRGAIIAVVCGAIVTAAIAVVAGKLFAVGGFV